MSEQNHINTIDSHTDSVLQKQKRSYQITINALTLDETAHTNDCWAAIGTNGLQLVIVISVNFNSFVK